MASAIRRLTEGEMYDYFDENTDIPRPSQGVGPTQIMLGTIAAIDFSNCLLTTVLQEIQAAGNKSLCMPDISYQTYRTEDPESWSEVSSQELNTFLGLLSV